MTTLLAPRSLGMKVSSTPVGVLLTALVEGITRRKVNPKDIVAVSAGENHTVGLKSDGTVAAVGDNEDGQCDASRWKDIVAVSAGSSHTVGLKSDGTVVAVGENEDGECDVSQWKDIVAVSAGFGHTVGLKSDGTVVAVGDNSDGQCDASQWKNIKIPAAPAITYFPG